MLLFFFFKQKTAYEMRISDWSSDVCSSDLLSGLADAPVRWIVDDAAKFVAREDRRGRRYDGILLDPPKYGRGPTGEVWKLEEGIPGLIADCRKLLDGESRFLFLTVYAVRMSALAIGELLRQEIGRTPC